MPQALQQNVRVTLQMGAQPNEFTLQQPGLGSGQQVLFGQLAESSSPRQQQGTYWGYTTRLASTLSQVFTDSPYEVRAAFLVTSPAGAICGLMTCVTTAAKTA